MTFVALLFLVAGSTSVAATATQAPKPSPGVTLEFAPAAPARLERRIAVQHELTVRSATRTIGDKVYKSGPSAEIKTRQTLVVTDELRAVAGGRPTLLQRHFDEDLFHLELAALEGPNRGKPASFDARSYLEGSGVVFTWIPAERDWARYYDEREELEEYLAELRQDLDLLALLPDHPVAPGDKWDVPPEHWRDVVSPCGRVERRWPKELDAYFARSLSSGIGGGLSEVFGGTYKGGGRVQFLRIDESSGVKLARLGLELDLSLARDQDPANAHRGAADDPATLAGPRVHVEWAYQARGELVWNLAEKRAERLAINGTQQITARLFAGASSTPTEETELAGTLKVEATLAPKR